MEEAKEKGLTCRTCDQFFSSLEAQQAHFKGEWHLFNLQRMLVDQARVDEATFTALRDESLLQQSVEGEDEDDAEYGNASSDSSSEDEDGAASNQSRRNRPEKGPRMRVTTSDGRVISFWRAILPSRDLEDGYFSLTASQEQGSPQLQEVVRGLGDATSRVWVYLMCSGGYFAGSVFDGNKVIAHKTYRRYTVRRKQGGSQSSRDAQGNKPKSAGAFMRRYHEAQLQREIRELLAKWKPYFDASALVFYYLPGGGINRHMFFYEGSPLGTKKGRGRGANPKLRSIPFPIERPSVTAIQKAHEILSTIEIEDEEQHDPVVEPVLPQATTPARPSPETDTTSGVEQVDHRPLAHSQEGRSDEERKEEEQRAEAEIIDAVRANDARLIEELFERVADTDLLIGAGSSDLTPLYVACELANADLVNLLLKKGQPINTRIPGYHYWTVLHRASADGNIKLVNLLLANGADPTIRGLISKTPYDLAPNKDTRNAFRRFAGDNPTLWDYDEAKVPPLTKEMEVEGRKKELEKKKKRKDALKARKAREREEEEARKRQQDERRKAKKRREQEERERKRKAEEEERERKRKAQQEEDEADEELQRAIQLSLTLGTSTDDATTPTSTSSTTPMPTKTTAPPSTASSTPSASSSTPTASSAAKASGGGPECDLCHKRMGEKAVPFYRLSFKYCSTKCVQEHRKQLGR
ncbi:ankyrin repeat and zinc finger domain protein, putative [Acanthamoeba castellanii str. Neff]|uniref:Ankyrin repeat and zinc finger domain protein, putative n=1 Tax=Acanthamoeba castellanii (strain ATCC 30010 / Neff) TaxID=1257118 RepID=L8H9N8_ACACF|nr:ankyrin repeat and zinc finger domain protein, putative [Acanthamoeba castellanii str. Neff]ELR22229.1 ankyrin repeat and zinc finger domain protein, putative [Acanthamoeba castellanii str. Neff]